MEKILHLTLKRKWFDMIASGEKKEEYREVKMYWATRLCGGFQNVFGIDTHSPDFKEYDYIVFTNGYAKDARRMKVEHNGTFLGGGRTNWGAEVGKVYYVLQLGKIISKNF